MLELLGVLGAVLVIGLPVTVIWLVVATVSGRRRLAEVEAVAADLKARLAAVEAGGGARAVGLRQEAESGPEVEPEVEVAPEVAAWVAAQAEREAEPAVAVRRPVIWARAGEAAGPAKAPAAGDPADGPVVMKRANLDAFVAFVAGNWPYALAAVSLALAGVFLVRYGIEAGYLSPAMRVAGAVALGVALIAVGERIRRRSGAAAGLLPATFSGAGFVSVFAGLLAARLMYGLIGPGTAIVALSATGMAAVVAGWFHGPFLAAVGLTGAAAAPFLVGGAGGDAPWLYAYFPLIAAIGLGIDTMRRWGWVSALALVLGYGGLTLIHLAQEEAVPAALSLTLVALLAATVPARRVMPETGGPMVLGALARRRGPWPGFPVRLAAGAMAASAAGLALLNPGTETELIAVLAVGPVALALALAVWGGRARGLADLWVLPVAAFLWLMWQAWPVQRLIGEIVTATPEISGRAALWPVVPLLLALAMTAGFAVRSRRPAAAGMFWTVAAVVTLPLAMVVVQLAWEPVLLFGRGLWALGVMAAAGLMVAYAGVIAGADRPDLRRASLATAMALALIGFAMALVLSDAGLTVGIAVLLVMAAVLDRRFGMMALVWVALAGLGVLALLLATLPAVVNGFVAPLPEVILAYGAAVAGSLGARWFLPGGGRVRQGARLALEAGATVFAALMCNVVQINLMLDRMADPLVFWSLSLLALPWLVAGLGHAHAIWRGWPPVRGRIGLAAVTGGVAMLGLGWAVGPSSPLVRPDPVAGPPLVDTLALAYLVPALVIAGVLRWGVPRRIRLVAVIVAAALAVFWAGLALRRFWQGDVLSGPGVGQGELYSYTVAMILLGAGLLYQAVASGSVALRRVAMGVIALTAAKVFLIDATGLSGLVRVVSFLGLGLALAGLAWLNAWAAARQKG